PPQHRTVPVSTSGAAIRSDWIDRHSHGWRRSIEFAECRGEIACVEVSAHRDRGKRGQDVCCSWLHATLALRRDTDAMERGDNRREELRCSQWARGPACRTWRGERQRLCSWKSDLRVAGESR